MPNPASSGTGYLSVASILQRMKEAEGWKYLDALDKNMAEYTKSGSKPCKDAAAGERAVGVSFEYVAMKMKKDGAPVEMVLPKEGSGYEIEANGLTKKGKSNAAAKQFLDWAISDEAMALYAKYFAAVSVAGFPVPEGLPKDISKVVYPNDFDWSAKKPRQRPAAPPPPAEPGREPIGAQASPRPLLAGGGGKVSGSRRVTHPAAEATSQDSSEIARRGGRGGARCAGGCFQSTERSR